MHTNEEAKAWLRTIVGNHVGANIRRYTFTTYTGGLKHNALGGVSYLPPTEGKVVEVTDPWVLVKTAPNNFCIVLASLLDTPVAVGDKVALQFYNLRRFDGTLADGSQDRSPDGICSFSLTGTQTLFPVKWEGRYLGINERHAATYQELRNPYLQALTQQCETMPVDGGFRRVVNVLVDAGAHDLTFVDPPEESSCEIAPAICCAIDSEHFHGHLAISYDRPSDTYTVTLKPTPLSELTKQPKEGGQLWRHAINGEASFMDVHFDALGDVLQMAIDDGRWREVKVTVLKPAPKRRTTAMGNDATTVQPS